MDGVHERLCNIYMCKNDCILEVRINWLSKFGYRNEIFLEDNRGVINGFCIEVI